MPESGLLLTQVHEVACWKVCRFWYTYGGALQSGNGVGTSKYDLVQEMFQLHQDIVTVMDKLITGQQSDSSSLDNLQRKIGDILSLQRRHITQFESCLDEFNRYLVSLGRLESFLQHPPNSLTHLDGLHSPPY